jgi:hypothetical protein
VRREMVISDIASSVPQVQPQVVPSPRRQVFLVGCGLQDGAVPAERGSAWTKKKPSAALSAFGGEYLPRFHFSCIADR